MLTDARKTAGLPDAVFDISSPDKEYTPGSSITLKDWVVRVSLPHDQTDTLMQTVQKQLARTPVFPTANTIGGKVASDTETMAYYALTVSCILVAIYIWIRFQNLIFGMAAIVALIHDVFHCRRCAGASATGWPVRWDSCKSIRLRSAWKSWPHC